VLGRLGPEPFSRDFSARWLYNALRKRHRQLKPLLLDQTFLAGLGNIYTDEALHVAKLHPLTASDSITVEQARALREAVRKVLKEGIRRSGASIDWSIAAVNIRIIFGYMIVRENPVRSVHRDQAHHGRSARHTLLP
jgi:formamidopyrimidine-DNA glycosylase